MEGDVRARDRWVGEPVPGYSVDVPDGVEVNTDHCLRWRESHSASLPVFPLVVAAGVGAVTVFGVREAVDVISVAVMSLFGGGFTLLIVYATLSESLNRVTLSIDGRTLNTRTAPLPVPLGSQRVVVDQGTRVELWRKEKHLTTQGPNPRTKEIQRRWKVLVSSSSGVLEVADVETQHLASFLAHRLNRSLLKAGVMVDDES